MWRVREVSLRESHFDFSSSGQSVQSVTQVVADGTVLANAVELTTWNEPDIQLIVCEECGIDRCQSQGWVTPRWTGSHVILLPSFAAMAQDEWALNEYRPPDYFGPRGIPVLDEDLAKRIPAFQRPHELPLIAERELIRAIQWTAPWSILGRFPEAARVRREDVIATSEPDLALALDQLEEEIARVVSSTAEVVLGPPVGAARVLSFYLDDAGATEWVPGVKVEGGIALALDTNLVVTSPSEPSAPCSLPRGAS